MRPRDLWRLMVDILSRCLQETAIIPPEQILDETLENCTTLSEGEAMLVRDTVSDTLHFERICEGMLNGYCDCMRRNKNDRFSMYLVAYLIVFRYTVLGGHCIRDLLYRSMSTSRLVEYLEYMINSENLMQYSYPYWSKYYDANFIMSSVCRPLSEIASHVKEDVIQWLLGKTAVGVVCVEDTENTQKDSKTTQEVSEKKEEKMLQRVANNVKKQKGNVPPIEVREMLYTIPEKRPPRIDCTKPPNEAPKQQKKVTVPIGFSFMTRTPRPAPKVIEEPVCDTESVRPSPERLRQLLTKSVPVRMTAGAIRREAQVYLKQMEDEKRALEKVEMSLRDSREFEEWQKEGKAHDAQKREAELLNRKVEVQCSAENAIHKRKTLEEMKKVESTQLRADITSMIESSAAEKESAAIKQRNQTNRLRRELDEKRKKAVNRAFQERFSTAADLRRENEQLRGEALEEEDRLQTQRLVVIQQIRQLRERNRQRKAELMEYNIRRQREGPDDVTYGGMSLVMLREELRRVKEESVALEDERRAHFRALREQEREKINALSGICHDGRRNMQRARDEERRCKQAEAEKIEMVKKDEEEKRALQVHGILKQKRRDRRNEQIALKEEERKRRNELLLLAKDTSNMEENHWMQQELCVINRLTSNQNERFQSGFR
ncbi:putative trichohyalin-like [Trypanosoma theileri]|uniref:Putative trichohyalin-like n=1 Tax=Trypanosoma theileri TaxID=67003 RepID=A0A1X0NJ66_9TRYP|nr:putative trichohyalin-like [Trypanosoma theileri]ORC84726.1 putative trichohyalin-like [Trypanosoma theileri]